MASERPCFSSCTGTLSRAGTEWGMVGLEREVKTAKPHSFENCSDTWLLNGCSVYAC